MKKLALLFLTLASLSSQPASAANDFVCNFLLSIDAQASYSLAQVASPPLDDAFRKDPSVIYYTESQGRPNASPFYASNEIDFENMPWDIEPTDMLVGFGTNSAWDLAVRKNAKEMVIGDIIDGPLLGQRYILAPIFKLAKTRVQFLRLLFGIDFKNTDTLTDIFKTADKIPKLPLNQSSVRQTILRGLKEKVISQREYISLVDYLKGPTSEQNYGIFNGDKAGSRGRLAQYFFDRYENVGRTEKQMDPRFSFLSSDESYNYMRDLFIGANVKYGLTDFADKDFYRKLKAEGDAKGYRNYTFSITNIIDSPLPPLPLKIRYLKLEQYRQMLDEVFPEPEYNVVIFMTTNWKLPHGFLRLERHTEVRDLNWIFNEYY